MYETTKNKKVPFVGIDKIKEILYDELNKKTYTRNDRGENFAETDDSGYQAEAFLFLYSEK